MYIDVSFPRPSSRPRLGILVHWLLIDSVLLTKPLQAAYTEFKATSGTFFILKDIYNTIKK